MFVHFGSVRFGTLVKTVKEDRSTACQFESIARVEIDRISNSRL
jgi:hypothetical protein